MKSLFDNIKPIIGLIIIIATYAIFFVVLFRYKDDNNAVSQVIIASVTALASIIGYYFGYSQGAAKKDETMNDAVNKLSGYQPLTDITSDPTGLESGVQKPPQTGGSTQFSG